MEHQEEINKLAEELENVVAKYTDKMPTYEICHQLIVLATKMALCCAPNELVGVKTILACVENGIAIYEQAHS